MKVIALTDIHGRVDKMPPYFGAIESADLVIIAGDLTNGSLDEAKYVLETIANHNPNILTIPGNMDTPEIVEYTGDMGYNIHKSNRVIDGIAFVGIGGALPFAGDYVYSEAELAELTEQASHIILDVPQIFVCHQPPLNTLNDRLYDGRQVGSQSVRDYIEKHQPLICFTGHIHEAIGIDTIGATRICNPGPVWKGYAYAEIVDGEVITLEIRN